MGLPDDLVRAKGVIDTHVVCAEKDVIDAEEQALEDEEGVGHDSLSEISTARNGGE